MRKKRRPSKGGNTKVAVVFIAFVLFIISISLAVKLIAILVQSQFDDSKRFTITVSSKKDIEVIVFSPGSAKSGRISSSLLRLKLAGNLDKPIGQFLAIPIDGSIKGEFLDLDQRIDSLISGMVFNYNKLQTNLTIVDCIKLFIFARSLPEREIYTRNVPQNLEPGEIDKIVARSISDDKIKLDGRTIQIINGTNISGLGNRLARLITNIGGDVIIVATANNEQMFSEISYIDDKNYTVERLSKILGFKTTKVLGKKIADIVITIGEDSIYSLTF